MLNETNKTSGKVRRRLFILISLTLLVLYLFIFTDYGIINRLDLQYKVDELDNRIETENKINDSLKLKISKLINDTVEIERIAREHYGMIKPGEKVFIIKSNQNK